MSRMRGPNVSHRLRPVGRLLALALVAGAAVAASGAPAGAVRTPVFTIENGKTPTATYGPIPGQYAATPAAVPEPSDCGNGEPDEDLGVVVPGPLEAACDTVPIRIIPPPNLGPTEDFLVTITVSWNPSDMIDDPTDVAGDTPADDIDVYFYDNHQIAQREDPESSTWTNMGESTEFGGPEKIKLFSPTLIDYNLVIVNVTGANIDYTVSATVAVDGFESPFEDLGPVFGSRRPTAARNDNTDNLIAPKDFSGEDAPAEHSSISARDIGGVLSGGALAEVPVAPDHDFESFANVASLEDQLAAPSPFGSGKHELLPKPKDVPAVVIAFWLVVAPLLALFVLVLGVVRRSRAAFSL